VNITANAQNHLGFYLSPAHLHGFIAAIAAVCGAITVGLLLHNIAFRLLGRLRNKRDAPASPLLHAIVTRLRRPALVITMIAAFFVAFLIASPFFSFSTRLIASVEKGFWIALFIALAGVLIASVYLFEDIMMLRYDMGAADNLKARRVRTQLQLLRRMAIIFLIVVDIGLILSLFQDSPIWHYGAGLLASAGLASLVLATAAKSTASNLLAGIQIALTEPIRLDDVVIVEGEWGRIEDITTTYVVVKIWDYRRLVVPLSYFIENPFQNWTRETADLMGTSFLYVDYSVPIKALREEYFKFIGQQAQWDGKIKALQVTNITEHTIEIRCLMSAKNAGDQFDLRCIVREHMLEFIQENYPDAFPRTRFASVPSGSKSGVDEAKLPKGARLLQDASAR
jgi:small-conductance mechanosensitive channel